MFTGIIKATGSIARIEASGDGARLCVTASALDWSAYATGESIAVNGVCLTATAFHVNGFDADVSAETLAVTTLGRLSAGSAVNLEPALALGERLGGHLVSGHVDGTGKVLARYDDSRSIRLEFEVPEPLVRYIAKKGSIAVDGVSLTVNEVSGRTFAVTIVPHTLQETIIGDYRAGSPVNIEVDMMAHYLERLQGADAGAGITTEFLKAHGYG